MNLDELLEQARIERGLRAPTVASYRKLLTRIGVVDDSLSQEDLEGRLLNVRNVNSRRAVIVAIRAVLKIPMKIPKGVPRTYDLPTEDQIRFALMQCQYEARGLLMMYGGLRIGEACAVTKNQLNGDQLLVDRQILEFTDRGTTIARLAPVKANEGTVTIPEWLIPRIEALEDTDIPSRVRAAFWHWGKAHGIKMNPHMLRKWHGTWLLARGVNIVTVSKQLRHTDPAITMRAYIMTDQDDIRKAFKGRVND